MLLGVHTIHFYVVKVNNWITQVYPLQALCMSNPISHPPEGKLLFLTRA